MPADSASSSKQSFSLELFGGASGAPEVVR
jgi:hypothetical protein